MMLRIVDLPRAMEARPAPPLASGAGVIMQLTDDTAPWNAGTWRIACGEGRFSAEPARATPQLTMAARTFAPIYNGFLSPRDAVRASAIRVADPAALDAMSVMFATPFAPFCPDDF